MVNNYNIWNILEGLEVLKVGVKMQLHLVVDFAVAHIVNDMESKLHHNSDGHL